MSLQPEGDSLRQAVKWIAQMRKEKTPPKDALLIQQACIQFNLSPADAEFLQRQIQSDG